jgi:putative methanogenesis marker protein 3
MRVKVNGDELTLPEGSSIKDAIEASGAPYVDGCVLGVIKGKEEFEKHVNKYSFKTTKGSIIIELLKDCPENLLNTWKEHYKEFEGLRIRWTTTNEVSLGPIKTELIPTKEEHEYLGWDVILSLSGFSADATHIIFSKEKHKAVYGVPEENKGVFARVVGGKRTIMQLTDDDSVKSVKPVLERKSIVESAAVTKLETLISDGNEIFTYVLMEPEEKSPSSVDQFFALTEKGELDVDYESESFLGFYGLQGLEKDPEYIDQRKRGMVTLRNSGKGVGRIYVYREDRVSTPTHTIVGNVTKGIQLMDIANQGDRITVKTVPERIMTLAMTQKEAGEFLESRGIKQVREGSDADNAVVVKQEPQFTMDIIAQKQAITTGVPEDEMIYIELNEKTPKSSWYFKKITGLLDSPVGSLNVMFAFPGMKVMMFRGNSKESKGLIPENNPVKCVKAGEIGITNMSRRQIGVLGVRFEDNDEFGPTGEPFQGTNIIGKVIKGLENLEKFKEGETVYVARRKF